VRISPGRLAKLMEWKRIEGMAKQITEKKRSLGICGFCQGEFAKSRMTQHLNLCKIRANSWKQTGNTSSSIYHLLVEGTYRPGYWMHLEVPADITLETLDNFLRDIWLECCDHLSAFTIGNISYASSPEDNWDILSESMMADAQIPEEKKTDELLSLEGMSSQIANGLSSELNADLRDVPVSQIEEKLIEMLKDNLPPGLSSLALPEFRPFLNYMASALQKGTLVSELEELEEAEEGEQSMCAKLSDLLSVGKKFSYVYDFGSSTNLSLRVIAERQGTLLGDAQIAMEDEDAEEMVSLVVMARNEQPALVCRVCGKPAVHVLPEWEYDYLDEAGLCDICAKKRPSTDELLPVVNSPRMGVCGYTGEIDEEDEREDKHKNGAES
jgi:hypothetical protein